MPEILRAGLYTNTLKHVIIKTMRQLLFSSNVDSTSQPHCVLRTTIERYLLAAG
ncbi:MAG: hypothetical protein H0V70_03680 [Ktedonobacteraceae bacterium]|nr:hypothetical protein [Ktedonobacteraceae bacterium]